MKRLVNALIIALVVQSLILVGIGYLNWRAAKKEKELLLRTSNLFHKIESRRAKNHKE